MAIQGNSTFPIGVDNLKRQTKGILALVLVALVLGISVFSAYNIPREEQNERPKATFVIAGWDYPDSYDQGIEAIEVESNGTGSWVTVDTLFYDDSVAACTLEWDVGAAIRITAFTYFNSTLVGVSSRTEGQDYQRHYVIVTDSADDTIFSQQNFTYVYSDEDNWPLYYYGYRVVLDFIPIIGEVYTVEIMYEIYY